MEGTGTRPGRATSRYGSAPPSDRQPVFSGPVRKWKKQWVSCQSKENKQNGVPPVLLYKWTAVADNDADEPGKRRFRYYPIVSLEKENTGTPEKVSNEAQESKNNLSSASYEMTRAVDGIFEDLYDVDVSFQDSFLIYHMAIRWLGGKDLLSHSVTNATTCHTCVKLGEAVYT